MKTTSLRPLRPLRPLREDSPNLAGLRVISVSDAIFSRQFRFPRSGKKRIRAKWHKRPENFRFEPRMFVAPGGTLYVPQSWMPRIQAVIDNAAAHKIKPHIR